MNIKETLDLLEMKHLVREANILLKEVEEGLEELQKKYFHSPPAKTINGRGYIRVW